MTEIVWEDPLDSSSSDEGLEHFPAALRERPGQWARVQARKTSSNAAVLVKRIKEGKGVWAGGQWESVQRKLNDEQVVYAKYVGPKGDTGERPPAED